MRALVKSLHNWIAIIAVLAVSMLGALAFAHTANEHDRTLHQELLTTCYRQNIGRMQLNNELRTLAATNEILAEEVKHSVRLSAALHVNETPSTLPLVNCSKEVPIP